MDNVTVLPTLPPAADEAEFVRWRTAKHHAGNVARPGVVHAEFCCALELSGARPAADARGHRLRNQQ